MEQWDHFRQRLKVIRLRHEEVETKLRGHSAEMLEEFPKGSLREIPGGIIEQTLRDTLVGVPKRTRIQDKNVWRTSCKNPKNVMCRSFGKKPEALSEKFLTESKVEFENKTLQEQPKRITRIPEESLRELLAGVL